MKKITFKNFDKLEYTRAEQFNSISVNLDFCGDDIKKISITSTRENEGKSFVSMQLLRTCANNGKKVVLVDCDLRKSRIATDYGVESDDYVMGLTHYLAGIASIDEVIYETNIENADIILAGKTVSNPVNLLKKPRFEELLEELSKRYDLVLVDTPPVQPVIDGAYIAQKCDGTILVINYGVVSVQEVLDSKNQIIASHSTILGTILNNVPFNAGRYYYKTSKYYNKHRYKYYKRYGYYGGYGYGYGESKSEK
ncbi:MAG: CpsD/CapB family tyrosine-protein kinase [Clostridia bacterium]|nr:CpsD/CapB family tyrosine-protein kinase [Clostridia bacterium]